MRMLIGRGYAMYRHQRHNSLNLQALSQPLAFNRREFGYIVGADVAPPYRIDVPKMNLRVTKIYFRIDFANVCPVNFTMANYNVLRRLKKKETKKQEDNSSEIAPIPR